MIAAVYGIGRYEELHQYDEAIRVAYSRNHPNAAEIASSYFQMLVKSGQEEKAGMLKERAGEIDAAIDLYLKVRRRSRVCVAVEIR
jgi:intraflagellar transport protein 172